MPFTTKNADFSIPDVPVYGAIKDEAFMENLRRISHQMSFYPPPPMNSNTIPNYNYSRFGPYSYDLYRGDGSTYSLTENNHEYIERNNSKAKKTTDAADSTHFGGLYYSATRTIITSIRAPPVIDPKKTAAAGPKKTIIHRKVRIPLSPIDTNVNINSDFVPEHIRRALTVEYVDTDPNVPVENRLRRCYSL